jgi:hypothetical protein
MCNDHTSPLFGIVSHHPSLHPLHSPIPPHPTPPHPRTAAFPYQTIADADLFGPCNLLLLKPNPKPTANFATLPGTDRRPLKPWQLCTEEEKTLEIVVACTLDCVLAIAMIDGVSVPGKGPISHPSSIPLASLASLFHFHFHSHFISFHFHPPTHPQTPKTPASTPRLPHSTAYPAGRSSLYGTLEGRDRT